MSPCPFTFLQKAGQVTLGAPARIMLDALADPVPAKVVYVAPRAQFTPKEVETRNEREKLMFRIKVRVDPAWLATHATLAKPGITSVAYIKLSDDTDWPPSAVAREGNVMTEHTVAQLSAVSLTYGTLKALDQINVTIPAGGMVGLIGPDGVSKSSLLALIAGARENSAGADCGAGYRYC